MYQVKNIIFYITETNGTHFKSNWLTIDILLEWVICFWSNCNWLRRELRKLLTQVSFWKLDLRRVWAQFFYFITINLISSMYACGLFATICTRCWGRGQLSGVGPLTFRRRFRTTWHHEETVQSGNRWCNRFHPRSVNVFIV